MITSFSIFYEKKSDLLAVKQRFKTHPAENTLIQVFSGHIKKEQIEQLLHELKAVFQRTPIIGTTTAGEIIEGQVVENTVVVNFTFFDSTTVYTALTDQYDDLQRAGQSLARALLEPHTPQAVIVFGSIEPI